MRPLLDVTLILTDLYLHGESISAAGATPPRLPAFETALAQGALLERGDWREWICRYTGLHLQGRIPVAGIARLAQTGDVQTALSGDWWLAQCVHLEAGVDRVFMRANPPILTPQEWEAIQRGFSATFASDGFRLVDGLGGQAYLMSASPIEADTTDPARVRGGEVFGVLPSGRDAATLKRLMTEIQMWLHEHPVNIARQERDIEPVNAFWIWGGGPAPVGSAASMTATLYSDDAFLRGLWKLRGWASAGLPQSLEAVSVAEAGAIVFSLTTTPAARGETAAQSMTALERAWFAPALEAVRSGRIARLHVHANDRLYSLTQTGLWRFWRARRPWTEVLI